MESTIPRSTNDNKFSSVLCLFSSSFTAVSGAKQAWFSKQGEFIPGADCAPKAEPMIRPVRSETEGSERNEMVKIAKIQLLLQLFRPPTPPNLPAPALLPRPPVTSNEDVVVVVVIVDAGVGN